MKLGKFPLFLLLLILFFVIVNLLYTIDTEDKSVIVNDRQWADTLDYRHWVPISNIELSIFNTNVHAFHPNNPFGLTYDVSFRIRYKKDKELQAKAQIEQFDLVSHTDVMAMNDLKRVPISGEELELKDFLIFTDGPIGKDFFERDDDSEYMYGDMASIQFYTSFFSDKYIEFKGSEGGRLLIKTNPILLFKSFEFQTFFWIVLIVFTLFVFFTTSIEEFLFILALSILSMTLYHSYFFWFSLGIIFIISIISKIKMRRISIFDGKKLNRLIPLVLPLFAVVFIYLYATRTAVSNMMVFYILIFSIMITILAALLLLAGVKVIVKLYLYLFFKEHEVDTIEMSAIREVRIVSIFRNFPVYQCDLVVNGNVIKDVYVSMLSYQTLTKKNHNRTSFITKYKTDGKGDYIFY